MTFEQALFVAGAAALGIGLMAGIISICIGVMDFFSYNSEKKNSTRKAFIGSFLIATCVLGFWAIGIIKIGTSTS